MLCGATLVTESCPVDDSADEDVDNGGDLNKSARDDVVLYEQ